MFRVTGPVTSSMSAWRGRGDEVDAEALDVVDGVVEGDDLQLAAVAGAGVHLADGQRTAQHPVNLAARASRRSPALADRCGRVRLCVPSAFSAYSAVRIEFLAARVAASSNSCVICTAPPATQRRTRRRRCSGRNRRVTLASAPRIRDGDGAGRAGLRGRPRIAPAPRSRIRAARENAPDTAAGSRDTAVVTMPVRKVFSRILNMSSGPSPSKKD